MFNLTKDKYLETIFERIKQQLENYLKLRKQFKDGKTGNEKPYRDMREKISVTKDFIPQMLKDIFEIFVDAHHKKSLLSTRKLIDEGQKR
jgi:hypothetical protein